MLALLTERKILKKKAQAVEEINDLFNKYDTIAIADLHKVRAIQLQQLSQKLRKEVQMRVVKNSLIVRVLKKSRKPNIENLDEHIQGSNILLLTNMNPFKLALLLEKNKTRMTAKAGDIAPTDIIIAAGNTGLPPGPAISELHDVGLRTKIDGGSVWVISDAVVVKKGEPVQMKAASILSKLGVKPLEIGLTIRAAYDNGFVFTSEQLRPKITEIQKQLEDALVQAFNLAINSTYPTPITVKMTLQQAHNKARNLAINLVYTAPEVISEIVAKAHSHMMVLALKLDEINKNAK
ncbi:MAG: 50S ribosomal protein L10 [Candidatus Bathyarchaeota archaeon]